MTYDELKAAHAAGAWIYGIEDDGKLHRIEDPQWTCPADRYVALVPYIAELGQEVGAVDPVEADNAKAADRAALAMIGKGYYWNGDDWVVSPTHTSEARDAARLDFMVHRGAVIDCSYNNDKRTVYRAMAFGQSLTGWKSSYREAIDAAMRQEGGK